MNSKTLQIPYILAKCYLSCKEVLCVFLECVPSVWRYSIPPARMWVATQVHLLPTRHLGCCLPGGQAVSRLMSAHDSSEGLAPLQKYSGSVHPMPLSVLLFASFLCLWECSGRPSCMQTSALESASWGALAKLVKRKWDVGRKRGSQKARNSPEDK